MKEEDHKDLLADAVQPPLWADALPRPWYLDQEKHPTGQPWFDVYALPGGDFAIYEPGHFQEVISYVLLGEKAALVWDTGMGIGDFYALVHELTSLPLIVVNSHTHFDHMGDNHRFQEIHVLDHAVSLHRVRHGLSSEQVAMHTTPDQYARPLPKGFDPATYTIKPAKAHPITPGHVFDLGSRSLQVLATPGHSPDSIMLLDKDNGILLTGDTFYPATLYAHLSSADGMTSDFATYHATMKRLAQELPDIQFLYCSHNEPIVLGSRLKAVAKAFDGIAADALPYQVDAQGLHKYNFEGFAIVTSPTSI